MDTIDLVFLVLTIFIAFRLYNVFGQKNEHDESHEFTAFNYSSKLKGMSMKMAPKITAEKQIRNVDPKFTPTQFLNGAQKAYEIIIQAFVKGDRSGLKSLISPILYESYEKIINERENKKHTVDLAFFRLVSAEIDKIEVIKTKARIHVFFKSEQTQLIKGPKGKLIEGDPDELTQIEEIWVFERPLKSSNPNWQLTEIKPLDDD
jgi:predicted lipid-binding transport protein (Tim44 family)